MNEKYQWLPPYENRQIYLDLVVAYAFGLSITLAGWWKGRRRCALNCAALRPKNLQHRADADHAAADFAPGRTRACFVAEKISDYVTNYPRVLGMPALSTRGISRDEADELLMTASHAVREGKLGSYKSLVEPHRDHPEKLDTIADLAWRAAAFQKALSEGRYLRRVSAIRGPIPMNEEQCSDNEKQRNGQGI